MIDPQVFKTSRENARLKLPPEEARNSFGYYIDIANDWELYSCPEELVGFLGIHATHAAHFQEIAADLGVLDERERRWVRDYVRIVSNVAKLLVTTGAMANLKYDLAETLCDWRRIRQFTRLPAKILDFGAGCGRQCVSAFAWDPGCVYTAIDSTLAAYTLQNMVFSYMDTLSDAQRTYDLLDFEIARKEFPRIADAAPGSRFHLPCWLAEEVVPEGFYDVMIGAHVHNELSGQDFMRLVNVAGKGLSGEGILYLRSELTVTDPMDFFDAVDLHASDAVNILRGRGFVPVFSSAKYTYLTTIFAREGSAHHKRALESGEPEASFTGFGHCEEISRHAGETFVKGNMDEIVARKFKTCLIGSECSVFDPLVKPSLTGGGNVSLWTEKEFMEKGSDELRRAFADGGTEVVVLLSHRLGELEKKARELFPEAEFPLRRHYWMPVVFLYKKGLVKTDPLFDRDIHGPADIPWDK